MKAFVAILSWVVLIWIGITIGSRLEYPTLGALFGLWMAYMSVNAFMVSVPEVTGLLTVNAINGKLQHYGTGLHFRLPWEQVKNGNFINLRIVTEEMEESYPSSDGPVMLVKWSFQYRPKLEFLERYISSDDHTIKEGVKEVGSSILSAGIARYKSEECKSRQHEIEDELHKKFENESHDDTHPTPQRLYGIDIVRVSLADVDFEPTVQAIRASQQVAKKLEEIATSIKCKHPGISDKDAMNLALIIHGKVKKDVVEVEGEGGKALAGLLIAASRGGK